MSERNRLTGGSTVLIIVFFILGVITLIFFVGFLFFILAVVILVKGRKPEIVPSGVSYILTSKVAKVVSTQNRVQTELSSCNLEDCAAIIQNKQEFNSAERSQYYNNQNELFVGPGDRASGAVGDIVFFQSGFERLRFFKVPDPEGLVNIIKQLSRSRLQPAGMLQVRSKDTYYNTKEEQILWQHTSPFNSAVTYLLTNRNAKIISEQEGTQHSINSCTLTDVTVLSYNRRSVTFMKQQLSGDGTSIVPEYSGTIGDLAFIQGDALVLKFEGIRDPDGLVTTIDQIIRSQIGNHSQRSS